jgi:GNAT superfamily N-acetyltransferase
VIRPAGPGDVEAVHRLVRALAEFEEEPDAVAMTPADLTTALFGPDPAAYCLVAVENPADAEERAETEGTDGRAGHGDPAVEDTGVAGSPPPAVVGFAIWHPTFSTWTGQSGMYLVDLFVRPEHRRGGHARALLTALAAVCTERGYRRLEWAVLDWNTPAQDFYRSIGAAPTPGWTTWRLDSAAIARLIGTGADAVPPTSSTPGCTSF